MPHLLAALALLALPAQPAPSADRLREFHDLLAAEAHVAGTPGDARTIQRLVDSFRAMGITDVATHDIYPLLATPISATLEIVAPEPLPIDLRERPVLGDPDVAKLDLDDPWLVPFNAYSASGDVTGPVVYANRGTREDFARLKSLGIDCTGAIVIARYGGNYRGYKERFARDAGAAALIIYSDPADVGYMKGLVYPEGTFANECCTQRGSILTLPYQGDPLTPGVCATKDAPRIPESAADLPTIPVQPVGYAPAREILSRMTGPEVPDDWQGGLPMRYRLTGGPDLRVRLAIQQQREIKHTANVIATIPGALYPDEKVVVGCHHDAWVLGASDPLSGTIILLEAARVLAEEAAAGRPPARTVVFAAWGAEEWGVIGSSEWVESCAADLRDNAVLYLNLDNAAMGPDFGSSSSPVLHSLILAATRATPQARQPDSTVFDAWLRRKGAPVPDTSQQQWGGDFASLGGGSDHVAFLCHAGVPSAGLGGSGSKGTAYHSAYDTLTWYRRAVGDDYEPALMLARVTHAIARSAADTPILPRDLPALFTEFRRHLAVWTAKATDAGLAPDPAALRHLDDAAAGLQPLAASIQRRLSLAPQAAATKVNAGLRAIDHAWLSDRGLPGRSWYRNTYAAPDEHSGYAAWVLPLLAHAVEARSPQALADAADRYAATLRAIREHMKALDALLPPD
jgi:N-acetylated-alpha-linked acidic dipeptidase